MSSQDTGTPSVGDYDLFFNNPNDEGADLVFGLDVEGGGTIPVTTGELSLPVLVPKPKLFASYNSHIYNAELFLTNPMVAFTFEAGYDVGTFKGFSRTAGQGFSDSKQLYETKGNRFQESAQLMELSTPRFQDGITLKVTTSSRFQLALSLKRVKVSFFEDAQPVKVRNFADYQEAELVSNQAVSLFEQAASLPTLTATSSFQIGQVVSRHFDTKATKAGSLNAVTYSFKSNYAAKVNKSFDMAYEFADYPINVVKPIIPVLPPTPPFDVKPYDHDITFWCPPAEEEFDPYNGDVVFNDCALALPPISVDYTEPYFVINTVELTNVETGEKIHASGVDFSTDSSSFAWSGSLSVSASEVVKLNSPTNKPVILTLEFNGNTALFLVQSISKAVSFNQKSYKVGLISPSALLDAPFSPVASGAITTNAAPQTIISNLFNTPNTGIAMSWQYLSPLDWIVKANTFSYQALSPIKAAGALLQGSAVFLYSELDSKTVSIKKKRPYQFWETAEDFIELEEAFTSSHSLSREYHQNYTGVYIISGVTGVVATTAYIKRDGYSGAELAAQVIAPTLTSNAALIDAGKYALGTAGLIEKRSLSMPIIRDQPLLKPADVVKFTLDGDVCIGTVLGTSISIKFNSQYQNFEVEVVKGFN